MKILPEKYKHFSGEEIITLDYVINEEGYEKVLCYSCNKPNKFYIFDSKDFMNFISYKGEKIKIFTFQEKIEYQLTWSTL